MFLFNQTFVLTACSPSDLNLGRTASEPAQDKAEAQRVVGSERQSKGRGEEGEMGGRKEERETGEPAKLTQDGVT